jgi:hypothetical protein
MAIQISISFKHNYKQQKRFILLIKKHDFLQGLNLQGINLQQIILNNPKSGVQFWQRLLPCTFMIFLKGYTFYSQCLVVEKVFGNILLQYYVPMYLHDPRRPIIVDNLKCHLLNHLKGHKAMLIVMAKDIVCVLATSKNTCSNRHVVWF